jgi:hypothetical protein
MCRFIEKLKRNKKNEIIFERKRGEKKREREINVVQPVKKKTDTFWGANANRKLEKKANNS